MTEPASNAWRAMVMRVIKVVGAIAAVGIAVWLVPMGSDNAPVVTTVAPVTTLPEPTDMRFTPGELDDVVLLPDGAFATAAAWDGSSFWVVAADTPQGSQTSPPDQGSVLSIDPENGEVLTETTIDRSPSLIVADADGVWVALGATGELARIDPTTGDMVSTVQLPTSGNGDGAALLPHDLALTPGSVWATSDQGDVLRVNVFAEEVEEVVRLPEELAGEIVTDLGEVWVLPRTADSQVTRIDPIDVSYATVPLEGVSHETTTAALVEGDYFVAGDVDGGGAVVTRLDPSSFGSLEEHALPGRLAILGWVAGSFGALDDEGVLLRLWPAGSGDDRLTTSWDGAATLFPVEWETWMLTDGGASLSRVLITGTA